MTTNKPRSMLREASHQIIAGGSAGESQHTCGYYHNVGLRNRLCSRTVSSTAHGFYSLTKPSVALLMQPPAITALRVAVKEQPTALVSGRSLVIGCRKRGSKLAMKSFHMLDLLGDHGSVGHG